MKSTFFSLVFILLSLQASSESFVIDKYNVSINVTQAGDLNIVEIIDVTFSEKRRGIFRKIATRYKVDNVRKDIRILNVDVEDWKAKVYDERGYKVMRIGDANKYIDGKQRYIIKYTVSNALIYHNQNTEFYWNIIGEEWEVPIYDVDYTIRLPLDLKITRDDVRLFTGPGGSTNSDAVLDKNGSVITGTVLKPLEPGEAVTLALRLPKAYFPKPAEGVSNSVSETIEGGTSLNANKDQFWYGPVGLIALLIGFFLGKKRTDIEDLEVTDSFYPPEDLSPPAVGTFYDGSVNTEDIISLIPFWGSQGYVKVKGLGDKGSEMDIFFEKVKDLPDDYKDYHKIIFNKIFEDDDLVLLSDLKNKIYSAIGTASGKIKKDLRKNELYDKEMISIFHSGKMIGVAFIAVLIGVLLLALLSWFKTGLAFIALAGVAFVIHFLPKKKSEKGIRLKHYLKNFRSFLKDSDPADISSLIDKDPRYFEKVFPYAVALGVDKTWTKKLSEMDYSAPAWYYYDQSYSSTRPSLSNFSSDFNVKEISSVFRSAPASSSSGGFSGGSSGGGFGGGGGGSW